jgi:cell division protein ZapB
MIDARMPGGLVKSTDLQALVQVVEQLIQRNAELKAQNKALRVERGQLIEKNEIARQKVEAMISRLKALEQDS